MGDATNDDAIGKGKNPLDHLKYHLRLSQEEALKYRKMYDDLLEKFVDLMAENDDQRERIAQLEQTTQLLKMQVKHGASAPISRVADVPLIFESVIRKMDRASFFTMMRTNSHMYKRLNELTTKGKNPINPFKDVAVVINKAHWNFGFNALHFYGWTTAGFNKGKENKVFFTKHVDEKRYELLDMEVIRKLLTGFRPKEFIFECQGERAVFAANHEEFLNLNTDFLLSLNIPPGIKTTISGGHDEAVSRICDILKPKSLTLCKPSFGRITNFFAMSELQVVEDLCINGYETRQLFFNHMAVDTLEFPEPCELYRTLHSFIFHGDITSFPCAIVRNFILEWIQGTNNLRNLFFMIAPNEFDPVLTNILQNVYNLRVKFDHLTEMMKKTVRDNLKGVDPINESVSYRLLMSKPKKQMAVLYYSNSLESSFTRNDFHSYFGFHVFDYFPER